MRSVVPDQAVAHVDDKDGRCGLRAAAPYSYLPFAPKQALGV